MMDNGHSIRWMHLHKQTDQLVIDYIVYKRYKSHLDLAISVLLFDRRFWDHVIIPMIAMSAILRPPNPQFATSEWFKRWISFKWFDKTETWKLRSIWSALGSSSALVPWTWTCQTERNSSTARQLDTPDCQSLSSLSQGPGSIPHLDPKSRQPDQRFALLLAKAHAIGLANLHFKNGFVFTCLYSVATPQNP